MKPWKSAAIHIHGKQRVFKKKIAKKKSEFFLQIFCKMLSQNFYKTFAKIIIFKKYTKGQKNLIILTTANHMFQLEQIETKNYVPIKQAILKFVEQAQDGRNYLDEPYVYTPKFTWHKKLQKYHWLEIHKQGTRYVCSKERLEHIDFKLVEAPSRLYRCWHC